MKLHTRLLAVFTATTLISTPFAAAEMNRTEATIVGAAVGGVVGNAVGNDMQSTLLGAAAGGLLGNLLSKNNNNYARSGHYNNRYYYGGREFRNQKEYNAYRDAVRRDLLTGNERSRYQNYRSWRRQQAIAYKRQHKNRRWAHQQWRNGKGHSKYYH